MTETPERSEASQATELLIKQLHGGDQAALGELFSRFQPRLWRTAHFRLDPRLAGRVDADDVLQESYLNAAKRLQHYLDGPEMPVFLWMRLIVNQTLVDVHRRHLGAQRRNAALERRMHVGCDPGTSISIAAHLLGHLTTPSGAALREEMHDQLEQALESMPEIDREVLALRHFEELSNGETARVLGIGEKAASNRYTRALLRLREIMQLIPGYTD